METTEFQIHSAYDRHAAKTMSRVFRKTVRRKSNLAFRVFGWFAVSLLFLAEMALAALGDFSPGLSDAVAIFAALVMLATLLFEDDFNAWIALKTMIPGTREADTRFTPECYIVTTQVSETRWKYESVRTVGETKDSFVFILGKRHAQQFPKAGFTSGAPEQFRDFIASKTGAPVRYVK